MWSWGYSSSVLARCTILSPEKHGEESFVVVWVSLSCLLWLGERGPEEGCWILALMYFVHDSGWSYHTQCWQTDACCGTVVFRVKYWARGSCKGCVWFYLLPHQVVLMSWKQWCHHIWTPPVSWVSPHLPVRPPLFLTFFRKFHKFFPSQLQISKLPR